MGRVLLSSVIEVSAVGAKKPSRSSQKLFGNQCICEASCRVIKGVCERRKKVYDKLFVMWLVVLYLINGLGKILKHYLTNIVQPLK